MGIADDMKKMAGKIVSSYQARISAVAIMVDEIHQLLDNFRLNREQMTAALREALARSDSLRRKDFDKMIQEILSRQDEREQEIKDLLKTFFEEQREVAEIVKKNLEDGGKPRIDEFKKMLEDIQARQRGRENEVKTALVGFQGEYNKTATSLRSLLDKGEAIRIRDFKEMLRDVRSRQIERTNSPETRMDEFRKERQDAAFQWHKVNETMTEKRVGALEGGEGPDRKTAARV